MQAIFNGQIIAESDDTKVVEGSHYFPPNSLAKQHYHPSDDHTICFWKGTASYYNLDANGKQAANAAWYYPEPSEAAKDIKHYVAFYDHLVEVR